MPKTKRKPAKNLGGRPKKRPEERVRRVTVYLEGSKFAALAARAQAAGVKAVDVDERVRRYAKIALDTLAENLLKAQAEKS